MGTKRVGLARVEALIENLKREIAWGGTTTFNRLHKQLQHLYLVKQSNQDRSLFL